MYPYLIQGSNVTVHVDGVPHTLSEGHIGYEKLKEAIRTKDWAAVPNLVSPVKVMNQYMDGFFSIVNGVVTYMDEPINPALEKRIMAMYEDGFDITPMVRFVKRLAQNPSKRAVDELYVFLEKCNLPITEDGNFIAYKKVRDDYMDVHSGSVLNKPFALMSGAEKLSIVDGAELTGTATGYGKNSEVSISFEDGTTRISMARNKVDDDKDRTCSSGLHFCSYDYLKSFSGERIVVLEINPADVVSIPSDYNHTKGRTAAYYVIGEVDKAKFADNTLESGPSVYDYDPEDEYDAEDEAMDRAQELHDDMYQRLDAASYADLVAIADELGYAVRSGETDVDLIDVILDDYEIDEIEDVITILGVEV